MRISDWSSDVCSSDLRRQIARAETHQRIIRLQGCDDDLAHLAGRHGLASAWTHDFDNDVFVDDQPFARLGLKGHHAKVSTAIGLIRSDAPIAQPVLQGRRKRSEEHTSELQSLMRNSYAVFC